MKIENEYIIKSLVKADLMSIAQIHQKAFTNSALSNLGLNAISNYYQWQLVGPHKCYAFGVFHENKLVGFCFGGTFTGSMSGFLKNYKNSLAFSILTHPWIIAYPSVFTQIIAAIKIIAQTPQITHRPLSGNTRSFGILSLAVQPEFWGQGVGKLLMTRVENEAIGNGFTQMHLSVHPDNIHAINLYLRSGWNKIGSDPSEWSGQMIKQLDG